MDELEDYEPTIDDIREDEYEAERAASPKATPRQIEFLSRHCGWTAADARFLTKEEASEIIAPAWEEINRARKANGWRLFRTDEERELTGN